MATTAEIRNKAAQKLGLFGTGQTLRSAISSDLDDAYTEVYGELKAKGIATWTSTGAIPDEAVEPVVSWVAGVRATRYSVPEPKFSQVMQDFRGNPLIGLPSAEDRLRAVTRQSITAQNQKIENF